MASQTSSAVDSPAQVLTIRGRTGAVLLMTPIPDEDAPSIAEALRVGLSGEALSQVRVIHTDDPSVRLLAALRSVCPNLAYLCLDAMRLPMTVEYASSRRRSAASKMLRKLMVKFMRRSEPIVCEAAFNGTNTEPLTLVESNKREQIRKGSMLSATAERVMQEVDANLPWRQRLELIEALAAVARLYPSEMDRKVPGPNRTVREMLFSACSPQRLGWFFNNVKALAALPSHYMELLPSGTTSNEALHAELKAWFRQTQEMHKSTLQLKLHILRLSKLWPHNLALRRPTLRQVDAATLLCRASALSPWKRAEWISFAASTEKACLPLAGKRKAEVATVREFVRRKPAFRKPAASEGFRKKRTPFNRPRESSLRIMGKRPAQKG